MVYCHQLQIPMQNILTDILYTPSFDYRMFKTSEEDIKRNSRKSMQLTMQNYIQTMQGPNIQIVHTYDRTFTVSVSKYFNSFNHRESERLFLTINSCFNKALINHGGLCLLTRSAVFFSFYANAEKSMKII